MADIIKFVNATVLDNALTVTADAIRAKTGDTGDLTFDMENGTGFKEAIDAIPRGGGSYIKISDVPPESDEGSDGDIWIVAS